MTKPERGRSPGVDPATFEIVRNSLKAVCAEMALVVAKSAYSPAVNEGKDFAGTVSDRDGNLVSQSEFDMPAFVGLSMFSVKEVIGQVGLERMAPGDIFMINDPYVASTHCNDIHFMKPVFYRGERVAFLESTAHWTDVGGVTPGSLNSMARTYFEEGVRIPAVRIFARGELQRDILALLLANMRESWERVGDLNAQCAALRAGDARLQVLMEKHGVATVQRCMAEVQNHSERIVRVALSRLPDGVYEAVDRHDRDYWTDEPVTFLVRLTIEGDHAIFDLSESDGAAGSSINTSIVSTTSSVFNAVGSILPPMPMNAGIMRAVEVKARRGSICYAQPPSAVSAQASSMEIVIATAVLALSQALPERGAGTCSTLLNTVFSGYDHRPGFEAPFLEYVWSVGGMGGTKYKDGSNASGTTWASTIQNIPVELQERRFPMFWRRYMLLPDSGGPAARAGAWRWTNTVSSPSKGGTSRTSATARASARPASLEGSPAGRRGWC